MGDVHLLFDDFNDNQTDTGKWVVSSAQGPLAERIREVNGRLEIRPKPSVPGVNYSTYRSLTSWDLRNSEIRVEVVQALSQTVGTTTFMSYAASGDNEIFIIIEDGLVQAGYELPGAYTILEAVPYDPAKHRWLRIRDRNFNLTWETSRDGKKWDLLHRLAGWPVNFELSFFVYIGAGTQQDVEAPGFAVFDNFNILDLTRERRVEERRLSVKELREEAAELASEQDWDPHHNNNDETNYPTLPFVGNYSKALVHDSIGDPDPYSYGTMLRALQSRDPQDFEDIVLSPTTEVKLTNPQAGLAFELLGADAQELTQPPAPRFDSVITAHEAGELYWMAVARDVPFINYTADAGNPASIIARAIASLNSEFPHFGGTLPVTAQNLFRGVYQGEQVGPYVSQFLLKGNVDPRRAVGQGRNAGDGFVNAGAEQITQKKLTTAANVDYLTVHADWLAVQNGDDRRGGDTFTAPLFIHTLRDGATYVHFDFVINAFYNAAHYLLAEPSGNQSTFQSGITGRPFADMEFPFNLGNPYDPPGMAADSRTQSGFATFGPIHIFDVLGEVLGRALRAVWWQKWGVHRRLRPEEFGGRVDNWLQGRRDYPIDPSIKDSLLTGGLAPYYGNVGDKFPTYLLPQAYPEGAPTHPAFGAGHSTGSGALATILKAFFDESKLIENPVQANATGTSLTAYTGPNSTDLTVGGELNKLAGNISIFRNAAGVHWRSDYTDSIILGERVAIRLLQELSLQFNEDDAFFQFTTFDGQTIRIHDGCVEPVLLGV